MAINLTTDLAAGTVDWAGIMNGNLSSIQSAFKWGLQLVEAKQLQSDAADFTFSSLIGDQESAYLFVFHLKATGTGKISVELHPNGSAPSAGQATTSGLWSGTGGVGGNLTGDKLYVGGTNAANSFVGGVGVFLPRTSPGERHFVSLSSQHDINLASYINLRAGWWSGSGSITSLKFAETEGGTRLATGSRMSLYTLGST